MVLINFADVARALRDAIMMDLEFPQLKEELYQAIK